MRKTMMTRPGTVEAPVTVPRTGERAHRAARAVAGFLGGFLVLNTYWGLGGRGGLAWVLGSECTVPLLAVWVQEAAVIAGIGVVLGRAGLWRPPLPPWIFSFGAWTMTASFAVVGLQNLLGDNTVQARLLFAPIALMLCSACAVVARGPSLNRTR